MALNLALKVSESFSVLEKVKDYDNFVLTYSGGKDSTLLALLFLEWLRRDKLVGKKVYIVHNDTQSELDVLEFWAREFMEYFCQEVAKTGNDCKVVITTPGQNFFFKVIAVGYPAPSFAFRWCVNYLKIIPNEKFVKSFKERFVLLTGHRMEESSWRADSIRRNATCAMDMSCNSYFFANTDAKNGIKVMPLLNWSVDDVWKYLERYKDKVKPLYALYGGNKTARYGCWHCTLVKIQWNIYNLESRYYYLEALRVLYRVVSDMEEMRMKKDNGYSKLGALNEVGRGVMLKAFPVAEKLSGIRLYGLDEFKIEGHPLRELFYEMNEEEADKVILRNLRRDVQKRYISLSRLKGAKIDKEGIMKNAENNVAYRVLAVKGNYFEELLSSLEGK